MRFVTEREQVSGCEHLGKVTGSSSLGGFAAQRAGQARSEAEMRDKARRLGADVVLVQSSSGGFFGAESVGEAYQCEGRARETRKEAAPRPSRPSSGQGGCEKDTDCKGDRVCESGKCVSP